MRHPDLLKEFKRGLQDQKFTVGDVEGEGTAA
jgi:hypothetical protein